MTVVRILVASVGLVVCLTAFLLFTFDNPVTFVLMAATVGIVGWIALRSPRPPPDGR